MSEPLIEAKVYETGSRVPWWRWAAEMWVDGAHYWENDSHPTFTARTRPSVERKARRWTERERQTMAKYKQERSNYESGKRVAL